MAEISVPFLRCAYHILRAVNGQKGCSVASSRNHVVGVAEVMISLCAGTVESMMGVRHCIPSSFVFMEGSGCALVLTTICCTY